MPNYCNNSFLICIFHSKHSFYFLKSIIKCEFSIVLLKFNSFYHLQLICHIIEIMMENENN